MTALLLLDSILYFFPYSLSFFFLRIFFCSAIFRISPFKLDFNLDLNNKFKEKNNFKIN